MAGYHKGNTFYIGEFDGEMEESIIMPLTSVIQKQAELKAGSIDLWVNSYGGIKDIALHVLELIEVAKAQDVRVRTMITSAAYSAGSMVAIAGTPGERYMSRNGMHLVHYGSSAASSSNPIEAERNHKVEQIFYKWVKNHYRQHCDVPDEVLNAGMDADMWHIPFRDAKRWRLCDHPLDRFDING